MPVALAVQPGSEGEVAWRLQGFDGEDVGSLAGAGTASLAERVAAIEAARSPRWVWADATGVYPALLGAGVRVARCHDLALTRALLDGHEGNPWSPPAPAQVDDQPALFAVEHPSPLSTAALVSAHAAQVAGVAAARASTPGFALLVATESACALAAAEMGHVGLPWRADVHDALLAEALGPRPALGGRPARLVALAREVADALETRGLNPDSQPEVLRAFRRAGVPLRTTRAHELRGVEHPAVAPLLRYKELARLHAAHGWAWREQWVRNGRFHPEYVVAGVVSGRWSSRGGGALQIPRAVPGAVVADDGWVLVLADAGQLEPRLLAALSGDPAMAAATRSGDLYAAVAEQAFGGSSEREAAKRGLLSAMYGGGAGSAELAALRRRFPAALAFLEDAARIGEDGRLVRSALGRTCPPPSAGWQDVPEPVALARGRARGRFTRNFVIQASAADWAGVLVAALRRRLGLLGGAELVFFQHDEVIVHAPAALAEAVVTAVAEAGATATRLVVGDRGVRVPLAASLASTYAAK